VGRSAEQVDAVFASLKNDFLALSSPFGGLSFRSDVGVIIFLICIIVTVIGVLSWFDIRRTSTVVLVAFTILTVTLLFTLPFEVILAGFSVSEFDPYFLNRYGAEISIILWIISLPLSYFIPRWLEKKPVPVSVDHAEIYNKSMQEKR